MWAMAIRPKSPAFRTVVGGQARHAAITQAARVRLQSNQGLAPVTVCATVTP